MSDINELLSSLNKEGKQFLTNFTKELRLSNLSEDEELQIVQIALRMIYADNTVKYSELKYFKLIRLSLKVSGELILKKFPSKTLFLNTNEPRIIDSMPEIEQFLEEDIMTESYLEKITSQYLEIAELPQFELIPLIGTDSLGKLTKNE